MTDLRARLTALYEKYRGQGVEYASWGDDLLNDLAALLREPPPDEAEYCVVHEQREPCPVCRSLWANWLR